MKELHVPEFGSYEEEAEFWDNLDAADYMEDDGQWFRFDTPSKRAVRIAILPEIIEELAKSAKAKGVTVETLVNVFLMESLRGQNAPRHSNPV